MKLTPIPMTLRDANEFVVNHHRHLGEARGARFVIGAGTDDGLAGVAIVGRPVARMLQDGWTAEIVRCCTDPARAPKGTCSFLYARSWRIWQMMGGLRMVTYTLQEEGGASIRGAGWKLIGETKERKEGQAWQAHDRKRDWNPIYGQAKFRWEMSLRETAE